LKALEFLLSALKGAESPVAKHFCHQKAIKEEIFNEKDVRDSHVYPAETE
jgi:hypothetical protein